jgi:hypothetical protein
MVPQSIVDLSIFDRRLVDDWRLLIGDLLEIPNDPSGISNQQSSTNNESTIKDQQITNCPASTSFAPITRGPT